MAFHGSVFPAKFCRDDLDKKAWRGLSVMLNLEREELFCVGTPGANVQLLKFFALVRQSKSTASHFRICVSRTSVSIVKDTKIHLEKRFSLAFYMSRLFLL